MRIAVVAGPDGSCWLCEVTEDGGHGPLVHHRELASAVAARRSPDVRWVWADTRGIYPVLLRAGVRVERCHDVSLTEALLLARAGRSGEPTSLAAAWARLRGTDPSAQVSPRPVILGQEALFDPPDPVFPDLPAVLDALVAVHADQVRRIAADEHPERFALLVAAESAGGLAAAEMSHHGLPWRADVHEDLLTAVLGPRPVRGMRPALLADLAGRICGAFGGRQVNPDSPSQVLRALAADGVRVASTRSSVLKGVDHPAISFLLEYKERSRLYTAHGWSWLQEWVRDGRFRPEYVVGGVVSGRWATHGGGALQIPRVLRRAVVADPGWLLVVADAAQLEPRVLAALSGDRALAASAGTGDLYGALAGEFGGDRGKAKIALLSAMYGGAGGEAGQLLAVLRRRFPVAAKYVEAAARAGEEGRVVRSRLGRTCPPPSPTWRGVTAEPGDSADGEVRAARWTRARGRFTRNFVVQASAADWALVLLAGIRRRLAALAPPNAATADGPAEGGSTADAPAEGGLTAHDHADGGARLVFFQHDEVIVHCPERLGEAVVAAIGEAAEEAGRLVFGDAPVRFPVSAATVACYADAKQAAGTPW